MTGADRDKGFTLSEVMVVMVLMVMAAAISVPKLAEMRRQVALQTVATRVGGQLMRCRAVAIMHRRATGLVFEDKEDGSWRCYVAEDGDGDGIRRDDLEAFRDPVVGAVLEIKGGGAGLGILSTEPVPDPAGSGVLGGNLGDPIRAGRGNIITFTPDGTATPCSVYFTDHRSRMRVIRVIGVTGRIRALKWRSGWSKWRSVTV